MGTGVLSYFALAAEPAWWWGFAVAVPTLAGAVLARPFQVHRAALLAVCAASLGFTSAQVATWRALPVEQLPKKAVLITGTVRAVELMPVGRRISIEHATLDGADAPLRRWLRVRLRTSDAVPLEPGDTVRVKALVRPPSPPAYPGGWDLQRDAFFSGLAGSGFALGYAERLEEASPGRFAAWVQWLRATIDQRIASVLPGANGAIAATLLTGLTAGIPAPDRAAFRDSGLAHLLAVAGLHIGIVMGLVMGGTRRLLSWSEYASLHWPCKQVAAVAALVAGGLYMMLTGMHVPIIRSFMMASLYTVGVLVGRRGISLRGLALAAVVLMLVSPQEVPGVSFQMSFSAVLALIAGYEVLRPLLRALRGDGARWRRFVHHLALLGLTSLLAGTASAPFGAYHFGHIQLYFILANMAAVPLTAAWVMPLGLAALALMPFGLEWLALVPMGWGIEVILWIARTTSALPAATLDVPHMPGWGLALVGLGIAWLGLWRTGWRLAALPVLLAGLLSPLTARPPDILVSADARLIGLRTDAGLFVEQAQGAEKFTVEEWQQYLGVSHAGTLGAAGAAAVECRDGACKLRPRADAAAALLIRDTDHPPWCGDVSVMLSAAPARGFCPKPWPRLIDRFTVWRQGSQAVWLRPDEVVIVSDRAVRGDRPWVLLPPPRSRVREP
jgi:competence protein ComEC